MNIFREDKNIQILITNDATAKGLDIEYRPIVVNYDLLYNAVEMEQRICRCHRQGQQSDVLVINLLSQENMSDVRILELINKRTLQFQGIFGMSDDIVGHFDETLEAVLQKRRTLPDIQRDFAQNLEINKDANAQVVSDAESVLFTTFTKDVAEKIQVSPQYIQEQAEFLNRDLWEVVKFYFVKHHPQYIIDDINQTLTLPDDCELPHMFYYWTGTRNSPYIGKRQYGMAKDFKPASGRITLTSILAKGIFSEIECATEGEINLETNIDYVHRYPDDLQREILKQNKRFYANSRQSIQYSSYYSANRISSFVLEKLERKGITISEEELNINKKSTALASLIFNKYEIEYEKAACIVDNILSEAFNNKYSKYDYLNDIRSFDLGWKQTFQSIYNRVSKKPMPGMNILNVGVGSGNEAISLFSNCPHITFVDIAGEGLERIKIQLPLSNFVVSKAENLSSLNENSYELYISLRTYNSSFFDINHAISEAYRVLKKDAIIIISIANGFLCSGEKRIIPGLIVPGTDFVDIYRGIDTVKLLHKNFVQIGFKNIQIFPTKTEIYLTAVK